MRTVVASGHGRSGCCPGRPGRAMAAGTLPVAPSYGRHRRGHPDPPISRLYHPLAVSIVYFSTKKINDRAPLQAKNPQY
jgi:hypothetical protein